MNKHRSSAPIIPTYTKVILFGQNVSIPSGNISSTQNIPKAIDSESTFIVPKNLFNLKNDSGAPYLVKQDIQAIGYPMQAAQDRFDNFRKINIKLDVSIKTKTSNHLQPKKSLPKLYSESLLKKYSQKVFDLQEKFKAYNMDSSQKKSNKNNVKEIVLKTERKIQNTYSIKFFTMEEQGVNSISKRVPINSQRLSKNERSSSRLRTRTRESEFHRDPFNKTFRLSNKNFEESHYLGLTQESAYVNTSQGRKRSLTTEESLHEHEEGLSTVETELIKSHRKKDTDEEGVLSLKSSQKSALEKRETQNLQTLEDDEQDTQSLSDYCHDATTGGNFVTDKFRGMHKNEKNFVENKGFIYGGTSSGHAVANPAMQTNYASFERNVVSLNKLKASITKAGIKPYKKTKWINQSNPFKKTQDLENSQNGSFEKGSSSYAKLLQTMYSQKNFEEDRIPEVSRDQETLLQTSLDNTHIVMNRALEVAKNGDKKKNDSKGKLKVIKHQNGYMRVSRKKIIVGAESMITDGLSILDKSQENSDH